VDIITPELTELLNAEKRKLIGRKLAMASCAIPEQVTPDAGGEGARSEMTFTGNTITSDRHDIKRHIERFIYSEIVKRNPTAFAKGAPACGSPRSSCGVKDFFSQRRQGARPR
jgi:hypothetical protein